MNLSSRHYDLVCKTASKVGGFLYGWRNQFQSGDTIAAVAADWRRLDICLKILEIPALNEADGAVAAELRREFHGAMTFATMSAEKWHTVYH